MSNLEILILPAANWVIGSRSAGVVHIGPSDPPARVYSYGSGRALSIPLA